MLTIYAAQKLLKDQFSSWACRIYSVVATCYLRCFRLVQYVQILHINNNHWVTVSNINFFSEKDERERMLIYDSLVPKKIDLDLKKQVCSFVCPVSSNFRFDVINIMPQPNSYDCGIFAIANATELLHGKNPTRCLGLR